jgi:hypothetical protein
VPDEEQFDSVLRNALGQQFEGVETSSPAIIVSHMTRLFSEFGAIAPQYSMGQIDQGIWGILGERLRLCELLWDESVPLPERAACIRSMCSVYSDFLCGRHPGPLDSGFYMWWDLILHGFWCQWGPNGRRTQWGDLSSLNADSTALLDVMFETLKRILELDDERVQGCALHGLGHLHHPGVPELVQKYIDGHKSEYTDEGLRWMEQCRDGTVM